MSETIPATQNQIHLSIDIALPNNLAEVNTSFEKWKIFLDEADQYAIEDEEMTKNIFNQMREFRDNFEMKKFSNLRP